MLALKPTPTRAAPRVQAGRKNRLDPVLCPFPNSHALDRLAAGGAMIDRAEAGQPPDIRFYLPDPSLRALVSSYLVIDVLGPVIDFTHPEWGTVRYLLRGDVRFGDPQGRKMTPPPDAGIYGPPARTWRFDRHGGGKTIGIGLTPLGWLTLIGSAASGVAHKIVPLGDELGAAGAALLNRLLAAPDDDA